MAAHAGRRTGDVHTRAGFGCAARGGRELVRLDCQVCPPRQICQLPLFELGFIIRSWIKLRIAADFKPAYAGCFFPDSSLIGRNENSMNCARNVLSLFGVVFLFAIAPLRADQNAKGAESFAFKFDPKHPLVYSVKSTLKMTMYMNASGPTGNTTTTETGTEIRYK